MLDAVQTANHKLIEAAGKDIKLEGMGTTLVVATVIDHTLYFVNVGDSRLYLINKDIRQLSRDHSLVEEMVTNGQLARADARVDKRKNIITRAIGGESKVEAEMFSVELKPKDKILMCSDGLSNMVDDTEILEIINREPDIEKAARMLIDAANENGGKDNISVVIVEQ